VVVKSVLGIILNEDGVLLIKRRDVPVWVLPGGGMDAGEDPESAIMREIYEETGLKVEVIRRVGTYTGGFFIKPVHLFDCRVVSGKMYSGNEVMGIDFFPLKKLPNAIPPPFGEFITDALKDVPPFEREITSITVFTIVLTLMKHPILFTRFILSRLGLHINT